MSDCNSIPTFVLICKSLQDQYIAGLIWGGMTAISFEIEAVVQFNLGTITSFDYKKTNDYLAG